MSFEVKSRSQNMYPSNSKGVVHLSIIQSKLISERCNRRIPPLLLNSIQKNVGKEKQNDACNQDKERLVHRSSMMFFCISDTSHCGGNGKSCSEQLQDTQSLALDRSRHPPVASERSSISAWKEIFFGDSPKEKCDTTARCRVSTSDIFTTAISCGNDQGIVVLPSSRSMELDENETNENDFPLLHMSLAPPTMWTKKIVPSSKYASSRLLRLANWKTSFMALLVCLHVSIGTARSAGVPIVLSSKSAANVGVHEALFSFSLNFQAQQDQKNHADRKIFVAPCPFNAFESADAGEGAVSVMVASVLNVTLKTPAAASIWLHGNEKNTSALTLKSELEQEGGDSESETLDAVIDCKLRDKNEMNESVLGVLGVKSWLIGCSTLFLLTCCCIFSWLASLTFGIKTKWIFG